MALNNEMYLKANNSARTTTKKNRKIVNGAVARHPIVSVTFFNNTFISQKFVAIVFHWHMQLCAYIYSCSCIYVFLYVSEQVPSHTTAEI